MTGRAGEQPHLAVRHQGFAAVIDAVLVQILVDQPGNGRVRSWAGYDDFDEKRTAVGAEAEGFALLVLQFPIALIGSGRSGADHVDGNIGRLSRRNGLIKGKGG